MKHNFPNDISLNFGFHFSLFEKLNKHTYPQKYNKKPIYFLFFIFKIKIIITSI